MEIDEVLVPTMAAGLRMRTERAENLALDVFLLGGGFDHEIAVAEIGQRVRRADPLHRRFALIVGDALPADLARQIAADGGDAFGNALDDDIVEQNVKARERADMGDAVAHLACADHADLADRMRHRGGVRFVARLRPLLHFDHLRLPFSTIPGYATLVNDRAFQVPGASSGKAV